MFWPDESDKRDSGSQRMKDKLTRIGAGEGDPQFCE